MARTERKVTFFTNKKLSADCNLKKKVSGAPGWYSQLSIQLDFCSGCDLRVKRLEPCVGLVAQPVVCLGFSLPLPLPTTPHQTHGHKLSFFLK